MYFLVSFHFLCSSRKEIIQVGRRRAGNYGAGVFIPIHALSTVKGPVEMGPEVQTLDPSMQAGPLEFGVKTNDSLDNSLGKCRAAHGELVVCQSH